MKADTAASGACRVQTVVVIDDHPLYCDALSSAIGHVFEGCSVRSATTLAEGLKLVSAKGSPDLVILDLKLPDVTGISGFMRLRNRIPDVPILVISALASNEVVEALMDAGAAGFLSKDAPAKLLRAALIDIRDGRKVVPPGFERTASEPEGPVTTPVAIRLADLTPQQARIMKLICAGKPNKLIAYELSLAEATVKAHITALMRRLGVQNRTQAAVLMESAQLDAGLQASDADVREFLRQ